MHAVRGDQYKYIHYYGIWDTDELYNIKNDPDETKNLIRDPAHREIAGQLNRKLFEQLAATDGMYIPLQPDRGPDAKLRRRTGSKAAEFPADIMREKSAKE
jgi:N-acetylglucosamine-6-sulfatase